MATDFIGAFGLRSLSAPNKYTGNGVSFEYPADYKITEVKNGSIIATNTKNPDLTFQISKSPVNGTVYHGMNLKEYYNTLANDFKSRGWTTILDNDTTINVDNTDKDVQTYEISYMEKMYPDPNSVNGHIMMFDKNGIRYTLDFKGKGKQTYDSWADIKLTTSFKVL